MSTTPPSRPAPVEEQEDIDDDNGDKEGADNGETSSMRPTPEFDPSEPMLEDDFDENEAPTDKPSEQQVTKLLHALWQRQDEDWTIRTFAKPVFQQLCFELRLSHRGTKAKLYLRLQPQVRLIDGVQLS